MNESERPDEIGQFQDQVRDLVIKMSGAPSELIDGKGSDAGWQEFTLAEISQGFAFVGERVEELRAERDKLTAEVRDWKALSSDNLVKRIQQQDRITELSGALRDILSCMDANDGDSLANATDHARAALKKAGVL